MTVFNPENPIDLGHRQRDGSLLSLDPAERRRHLYTIGSTGSGKTTFLQSLILQDINRGAGVCVIDPHGDMAKRIASSIPRHRINETVYLDTSDIDFPIGFNPLAGWPDRDDQERVALSIVSTFKSLWRDSWGEWLDYLLKNTMLALMKTEAKAVSLASVNRMLEDARYRATIVSGIKDPILRRFWLDNFEEKSERDRLTEIRSTINKAGKWTQSTILRNIVCQPRSGFSIEKIMDEGGILIVNLSKGTFTEDNTNLLGSLLVSEITSRAMQRARLVEDERRDFHLYIDEFQNFTTDNFATIVSEARKYRLCLSIAHQEFDQIDPKVRSAILKNAGTLAAFRVNFDDAEKLAASFRPIQTGELSSTNIGDFWCRPPGSGAVLCRAHGPALQEQCYLNSLRRVQNASRERYGRPRRKVEADFARW